jgi:hypothetical protein
MREVTASGSQDTQGQGNPQGQPQGQPHGLFANPGLLAAGAAGFAAAFAVVWALHGLPGGTLVFWAAPLPLFAAGLAFRPLVAVAAAGLTAALLAVTAGIPPALVFLALFGVPVALLLGCWRQGSLGLALAMLGLWPLVMLLAAALFLADDGGLDGAMRASVEGVLLRLDIPASDTLVATLVRLKAGAIGFWAAIALLGNATVAMRLLARGGLLAVPAPAWSTVRLPGWYPLLPPVAALAYLAMPEDAVPLSALLLLLVPLFFQGVAGVHRRLEGRQARPALLAAFYMLLVMFLQVMGPGLIGLALYDQFRRRAAPRNS